MPIHPRRLLAFALVLALAAWAAAPLVHAEGEPAPPAESPPDHALVLANRLDDADVHGYQLSMEAGDLTIQPLEPIPPMLVELRTDTGDIRRVDRLGDPAAPSDVLTIRGLPAGTYTLALTAVGGASGPYRLGLDAPGLAAGDALPTFTGWGDGMRWMRAAGTARWQLQAGPGSEQPDQWQVTLQVAPRHEVQLQGLPAQLELQTGSLAEGLHSAALTVRNGGSYTSRSLQLLVDNVDSFRDVPASHWARTELEAAAELGLAAGYPDGRFRPEQPVTRAELVKLIVVSTGLVVQPPAHPHFTDVQPGDWYYALVKAARSAGIVEGEPVTGSDRPAFRPERAVTRAEAAVMLARVQGLTLPDHPELPFADQEAIPAWARPAVAAVLERGLMAGFPDGRFGPREPVTRGQAGVIALRLAN